MFKDRKDAGQQLARALERYRNSEPLICAIPRGGVEVGFHVAAELGAELAVLVVRKLPLPHNLEAGFGAIAEDGSTFMYEHITRTLPPALVSKILEEQKQEVQRRIEVLRHGGPLPALAGRTVIIVDDGIAMGSTIRAAVAMCRRHEAEEIIIGTPVASPSTAEELKEIADDIVVVEKPPMFRAVAQVYQHWYDVPDAEVLDLLHRFSRQQTGGTPPSSAEAQGKS